MRLKVKKLLRSGLHFCYAIMRVNPITEYVQAAKRRYQEVEDASSDHVLDDDVILSFHVGSPYKEPNVYKVKTRIISTVDFMKKQLSSEEMQRATFIDVGGSSTLFYDFMGIETSKGHIANVLEEHLTEARKKGWGWIKMEDDRIEVEDDRFDYCLCFECLEHSQNPLQLLHELLRVSRKGVFLSIPWRPRTNVVEKQPGKGPFDQHIFELSSRDLERLTSHVQGRVVCQEPVALEVGRFTWNPGRYIFRKRAGYGSPNILLAKIEQTLS
ncbi:MAG: class I SAM-dependent methyltransferase [SAR202 cluster bacterium]|nr:class I SAM-dependent methyltransferase [SAR202 cluster bacterium]|tara:strand:+ start:352 stop:1161 length:810 start_codon:yes stop_codon:yes gene_type:complete